MAWRWNERAKRYYDLSSGRFMSRDRALSLVDSSLLASNEAAADLATLVAGGRLAPGDWQEKMREEIKREYLRQYLLGRGGVAQMTAADWGSVGGMIAEQYGWLEGFAGEVGGLAEGQIAVRSAMYVASAREAYERGKASAHELAFDALPAYPGDGSTICLTNDRCTWEIEIVRDEDGSIVRWECYWVLDAGARHCATCLDRASGWSPYVLEAR